MDDSENEGEERGIAENNSETSKMKIIKVKDCSQCTYLTWIGVWRDDPEAGTSTEPNLIYDNTDKLYCLLKKRKSDILGKFIMMVCGDWNFVEIPKWCPLEDYKK